MTLNLFMPKGLPLLSDAALINTMLEYRQRATSLPIFSDPTRQQIEQALQAIEEELRARGLRPEVWRSSRPPRPSATRLQAKPLEHACQA